MAGTEFVSRKLSDAAWSAICQTVPSALTRTPRSRLLVDAIIQMMSRGLTWAEATPEGLGETTLYSTANSWADKEVIGPLVTILDKHGLTEGWQLGDVTPAVPGKRPHLKQFIGLKLLELRGQHPRLSYVKDWCLSHAVEKEAFVLTPELKARNLKLRAKIRRRKKQMSLATTDTELQAGPTMPSSGSRLVAA